MMTRLLLAGFLLAPLPTLAQHLPLPPIPPLNAPSSELAPMPDLDVRAPRSPTQTVRLRPEVFSSERPDTSLGFAPGSRYQTADERRPLQTPGLRLTVPLQ